MKQFYFVISFLLMSLFASAQNAPFITTWEVTASDLEITIPTKFWGYNYTIDFGDGTILNNQTGDLTHTYNSAGIYTVSISGDFPRIYFEELSNPDNHKIISIEQWGDIQWTSMEEAFKGCGELVINATDAPDLSQVTSLSEMFNNCEALNQSINHWDVSTITDMSQMFYDCNNFNQPLNSWDISSVTNLEKTFYNCTDFNQPLYGWDVSSVTNMSGMFDFARNFNQALDSWDVSNVIDMSGMFHYTDDFNQPLNNWDVSNVQNMAGMFSLSSFNQPLDNWDVSNVTRMGDDVGFLFGYAGMFADASNFNQDISNWDVSNVTDMTGMFRYAVTFNQPLDSWNVSNVLRMDGMFSHAESFNQSLDGWDVSNVTDMSSMFLDAIYFNQDLSNWNFNTNVLLGYFVSYTAMNIHNYDALLAKFAMLNLINKTLSSNDLKYCDVETRNYLINNLNWSISLDQLSNDCNYISGDIIYDENNNGCDANDILVNNLSIISNDGNDNYITFSNNGIYELPILGNNFTVSLGNLPVYYSASPTTTTVTFTNSNTEVANFCLTTNQAVEDLNITLIPVSEARPGFDADYQLVVQNVGTQTIANPSISLDFDNTMQTYVSALPNPSSTSSNQLNFGFTSIAPFESKIIDITMNTFQPPTVNGDDILSFTASVTPNTNDYTPADNTFVYDQTVVNSYDPNDKQVLQGEEIYEEQTDEYLDYLIRFQNTGTASAINVRILDTLHPNLDYNTLKPINASHDYHIEITDGNQVEFIFDDINLPDETSDEPGSHGFVAYKIKPKSNVGVGDFITGDAQIYFDFNAPIITNMVSTEVVDNLSTTNYDLSVSLKVYPNPTQAQVYLTANLNLEIEKVTVYNLQGKTLLIFDKDLETLNVEDLSTGIYLMKIETNRGVINKRLIKK